MSTTMIIKINRKLVNRAVIGPLILLSTLLLGLAVLELFVRKIKPQITYTEATNESFGIYSKNKYSSFTLMPNLRLSWMSTNSLGYRNREFQVNKPAGFKRVLFLGDSFVFGGRVQRNEDAVPQITEEILKMSSPPEIEVINAGFKDGFSPDFYYAYLKSEGLFLNPDAVIIGIYLQNDLGDMKGNRWEKTDGKGLPVKVVSEWRKVDSWGRLTDGIPPLRYRYSYLKESHLWILFANWMDKNFPVLRSKDEAKRITEYNNWFYLTYSDCIFLSYCFEKFNPEFEKLLHLMKGIYELTQSQNIPVLFVFFPSRIQTGLDRKPALSINESLSVYKKITQYFNNQKIKINLFDLTRDFYDENAIDYYNENESHLNMLGNKKAAAIISQKIRGIIR